MVGRFGSFRFFVLLGSPLYYAGGSNDGFGAFDYLAGYNAVFKVVAYLFFAVAVGFVYCTLHAACDGVAVEDGFAVDVTGGAADGLDEGAVAAEESFFVGIEDGDERHFGEVEAFTQEVDAYEDVEDSHAEIAHDFDTFEGVDVAVDVFAAYAEVDEVGGHLFGHAFGEGGYEYAFVFGDGFFYFVEEVVDLADGGTHFDNGVEKTGGTDDLFYHNAFGFVEFVVGRGSADVDGGACDGVEFVVGEGAVVECRGEAEAVFDE